ncbi:MAG: non-ribosomal peptide synthase/polyketide synthase [Thioploca sp.]|nr:non-ribosomal peptide synthase/polyketide synthase [Thioploca sp.]
MNGAPFHIYPLTSSQREIWFDQLLHEGLPLYNIGGYVNLPGSIDPVLFEQSANLLVQKHDALRTFLVKEPDTDGIPRQTFVDTLSIQVPLHDFTCQANPQQSAMDWIQQRFMEPFELIGQPLFRYDLLKISEDNYYWLMQYHHLIVDGYAVALLNRSLAEIYTQLAQGQIPNLESPSYIDFINYNQAYIESETFEKQRQYWLAKYLVMPKPLFNPRYRSQSSDKLIGSGGEVLYMPRSFYQQLNELAKQHQVTLFRVFLGALYVYFTRIAQRNDFAISFPTLNRPSAEFKQMAGLFTLVNSTLFNFDNALNFAELLQQIHQTLTEDFRHQPFPNSEINRAISKGVGEQRSSLFDISLSYQRFDYHSHFNGIDSYTTWLLHPWEQTPLVIYIQDFHAQSEVKFDFVYNQAYFNAEDIKALQARFITILEAVLQNSVLPISALPIMTEQEAQQLQTWNNTTVPYPQDQTIVDLFEQQVAKTPNHIAIILEDKKLTYQQLNAKANQLAHYLLAYQHSAGIHSHNPLIAIAVGRSLEMVIGLLGILKAGAAYFPLDLEYPLERLQFMLTDSQAPILLTEPALQSQFANSALQIINLGNGEYFADYPVTNPRQLIRPEHLAYLIYTSGSTGKPKGVLIEHQALISHCYALRQQYQVSAEDVILQFASIAFDTSLEQLLMAWLHGATNVLLPTNRLEPQKFLQFLQEQAITIADLPPAYWQKIVEEAPLAIPSQLHTLILGGEALPHQLVQYTWQHCPQLRLFNAYGPTEATITPTLYQVPETLLQPSLWVPIGSPRANTRIYILDKYHQLLPPGIPGELCIAGVGLARGYLNRPDLTAEKFIEVELFGQTERIYKTGDLARWLPDGNLEYLGRLDHQVKLRGFRIELGEIETVLNQHPTVKEAVVTLSEVDENKRLVAYLTPAVAINDLVTKLREWLRVRLPDYMLPSQFMVLEQLPLTPNGKIDRNALPAPTTEITTGIKLATPTEDLLASLWANVLKREAISRHDNFFELGGHSLLATQLISRIRDSFQVELPVRVVFEQPQLSNLATTIEAAIGTIPLPLIEKQPAAAQKVLSFAQQRLWFLNQLENNSSATYNIPIALQLSGNLDVVALQQSLHGLLERHTSLRTIFPSLAGQATVQIQDLAHLEFLQVHDLRQLSTTLSHEEIQDWINRHALEPFDLAHGPLFKADLLLLDETQSILLLNWHHIISDGWSIEVFIRDWQHAYTAFAQGQSPNLPPLPLQYSDYAAWQRDWLQGEVLQQQLAYWCQQLAGAPQLLELPTDKPRPPQQSYQGAHYTQSLSPALTAKISTLSRQQGVSVFMTLLSTFYLLLLHYSRQEDVCVGSPIANRTHRQTEDLIGFFVNTLVLRGQLQPQQSFLELLQTTRQTCLAAYAHQDLPFEMLVEQLQPNRSLSYSPLFQVMFVFHNHDPVELTLPGLDITTLESNYPIAKFDLTLYLEERQGQLHSSWEYATDLFTTDTIKRMAKHFEVLLTAIVANPTQALFQISMLTVTEKEQLQAWNNTAVSYSHDLTIVDLFEQQVTKIPDKVAVVFEDQQLTYRQLNTKANQLAHQLLALQQQHHFANNPLIAIAVERSLEMVSGLLAILKAGGAYVPIDLSYPPARIRYLLEDSAAPCLLTQRRWLAQLPVTELASECVVVCIDEVDWAAQPTANPVVGREATDLAYVIYTSGSTGNPKGVMIEHHSAINLATFQQQYFHTNTDSQILQFASLSFDAATWEILMSLGSGATLQVVPLLKIQADLKAILQKQAITHVTLPPSVVKVLSNSNLPHLKYLTVAGEACSPELVKQWAQPERYFINAYGPTETTVCASVFECVPDGNKPPIGRPIANTRIYILDAHGQLQPPGIPGELCIAGVGLARGYLNRPDLTAEKFIEVKLFGQTERIYKTGDLARWRADGNLEYLGRLDHQIKLRGFRIELGEIETVLSQHPAVKEAVVIQYTAADNPYLVAYLTTAVTPAELITDLKNWLSARLPNYMIPSHFMVLEQLPLTPNGKIDRQALPTPRLQLTATYEAPRNDLEQQLAHIWSRLLKQNNLSIHDNFFELGGDSILSIQVVAHARQAGLQLAPRDLFEHQTIAQLATVVRVGMATDAQQDLVTGEVSLTPIQHWFVAKHLPQYWHFNQSILLQVPNNLNEAALRQALATVLSHHDALRLRYREVEGQWQQWFTAPSDTVPLFIEDLNAVTDPLTELYQLTQHYQTCLNLTTGPVTQLVLFKWGDSARLFWCIHHLVVDGVSWRILQEDLHTAYSQMVTGQHLQLPAKTSSFKAWAERLTHYAHSEILAEELAYWQSLPTVSLPIDNRVGANRSEYHQDYTLTLSRADTEALLREVPVAYNTRINEVLLTALALALVDWTGNPRCLIALEGHGRIALFEDIDLSRTVGWFTTIYPVVLTLPSSSNLGIALKAIKEQLRAIPHEGIGYGLLTQLGGKTLPKGEILFNYLGQFDLGIATDGFKLANEATGSDISLQGERDYLIEINGAITQGQLRLQWSYSSDCYQPQTIKYLADNYQVQLQHLIRHCQRGPQGVTPSDFPLAQVTQATLDGLYQQYAGLQDLYPLSPMQQGMLFHTLSEPESGVYFQQLQWTVSNLDPRIFQAAWQYQLERHPVLRSALLTVHHPMLQIVLAKVPLPWREHDWRNLANDKQQSQLAAWLQQERTQGFELNRAPLMRFDLIRLTEQRYVLIQHFHHLLMDGWCLPILISEVRNSYLAFQQGQMPQLPSLRPYRDYIAWLQQQDTKVAQHYWQQRLAGWTAPTPIPILNHKTKPPVYQEIYYALDPNHTQTLQRFTREQRVTLNTLVQGVWALLLSRYSREAEVGFGVTVSGRHIPLVGIERMVGLFINTLPLRLAVNPQTAVMDYLPQVQTQHQQDHRYAHTPLFEIQSVSEVPNSIALFESLLIFENYPLGETLEPSATSFQIEAVDAIEYTNYPLTVAIVPEESLGFKVSYDSQRVSCESIERLWGHFQTLLLAMVANPKQALSQLPMLTAEEMEQLQAWNQTAIDYPHDQTIVDLFEQQVAKTPENIAVVFEDQQLTYQQLNAKANQLAYQLLAHHHQQNLPNNPLIAIAVERSLEMVIGLLAILKAGGAYVPIDPNYPPARIRYMLEDSAAPCLLTQRRLLAQLPVAELVHECVVVCIDEVDWTAQPSANPVVGRQATDLAYVIYTSGSTGNPKGVMIEHHNLLNFLLDMQPRTRITTSDKLLAVTTLSFDIAALELYLPLISGSLLCLVTKEAASDGAILQQQLLRHDINFMQATPATWQLLKHSGWQGDNFLNILCGGEALSPELANYLLENSHGLWNVYGPTETTIWSAAYLIPTTLNAYPSIGHPIANTRIYILDVHHQLQSPGLPGELCIAGAGLARGYLNRSELTAEKFIEVELFGKTERIYKTGDLARWLPDGNLEYLGRLDHQVKLRGFRVELGEIEAILTQHPVVKEAVVNLLEVDDNKRLIAYFTTVATLPDLIINLKDWLKARLPDYMIPSQFMVLEQLPLTPNGKIDRNALPAPTTEITTDTKPATPTEDLLASLWANVLKRESINRHDNFFELGGHSLLATRLISQIRDSFQVELPVRVVFEQPQLSELAKTIATAIGSTPLPPIGKQPADAPKVLSFAQQRLWFLNQLEENNSATYNMPAALYLSGQVKVAAVQQSLQWLLERHASLRMIFPSHDGQATVQIVEFNSREVLQIHDLRHQPEETHHDVIQNRINRHALKPFDLEHGPLFKADLLLLDEFQSVLLLNWHHIINDGWSMRIFIRDWQHAYTTFAQSKLPNLLPLTLQYSDYAAWQRKWLQGKVLQQQLAYWRQQLAGAPELLELPTDKPRPPQQSYQGAYYAQHLSPTLTAKITTLSHQQGVSVFMTLLSAFYLLLSRYSRQEDLCVGSPIANRTHLQTEDLIGFFVNTLVLRSQLQPQQSFLELLQATRQTCLAAYAHQELPFEMLVEQLQSNRSPNHNPLFQVVLVLQNQEPVELTLPGLDVTTLKPNYPIAKFDLTLYLEEQNGQLHGSWEYATDLFVADTIKRMAGHFEVLLTAIVANPTQALYQIPMLTVAEIEQLQAWNHTVVPYPRDLTVVDLFEQQVERTSDKVAVVFEDQQLTYRQLNAKANQLAHQLLTLQPQHHFANNPLIAIAVERSLEMIIGLLGILKAGGVYVPIDPSYPPARIRYLLEDSAAPCLLTQRRLLAQLPVTELASECVVVCVDEVDWTAQPSANPVVGRQATDLVYVIYTSGSTGKPKGVMIEHHNLSNFLLDMQQRTRITTSDKLLAVTTLSFDIAALELYLPLISGSLLYLVTKESASDGLVLQQQLLKYDINFMQATPATWQLLKHSGWQGNNFLNILCGGEALSPELANYLLENSHGLWNVYGPTETTIWSSAYLILTTLNAYPSIGHPIANTRIYILDAHNQLQPPGIPGELCIAGAGLARGYLNRPDLTAEKFIEVELFGQTERIYKTGDLARWLLDGNLEYLGRLDYQVKLRGFRIELGEIEVALTKHPQVQEAAVIIREEHEEFDDKRLLAYFVPQLSNDSETVNNESPVEWLEQWQQIWNGTYSQSASSEIDPQFNTIGWNSSYTGLPISKAEMKEWLDGTVDRILSKSPHRILEIGCGTGMLLFHLAPHCNHYTGTDISSEALYYIEQQKKTWEFGSKVTLFQSTADNFKYLKSTSYDAIILNSVIQYFPSIDYLITVLASAITVVAPGGFIFIGDVRNFQLLEAFHTSVQFYQAHDSLSLVELRQRVQKEVRKEKELLIDPDFFIALKHRWPQITQVQIQLKSGYAHNEMTRFRYDVTLYLGDKSTLENQIQEKQIQWLDWQNDNLTLTKVHQILVKEQPDIIGFQEIPNARLVAEMKILEQLAHPEETVQQLRTLLSNFDQGTEPEDFHALIQELAYKIYINYNDRYSYNVVFQHQDSHGILNFEEHSHASERSWHSYANNPLQETIVEHQLVSQLRDFLKQTLPNYMIPSALIPLESMPLTPNGKIDRKALTQLSVDPDLSVGELVTPQTREEQLLANIWAEILGIKQVGIHNNFFDLGGNSMLIIRMQHKLSEFFDQKISVVELFEHPTIYRLAQHLTLKQTKPATQRTDNRHTYQMVIRQQKQKRQQHRLKKLGQSNDRITLD